MSYSTVNYVKITKRTSFTPSCEEVIFVWSDLALFWTTVSHLLLFSASVRWWHIPAYVQLCSTTLFIPVRMLIFMLASLCRVQLKLINFVVLSYGLGHCFIINVRNTFILTVMPLAERGHYFWTYIIALYQRWNIELRIQPFLGILFNITVDIYINQYKLQMGLEMHIKTLIFMDYSLVEGFLYNLLSTKLPCLCQNILLTIRLLVWRAIGKGALLPIRWSYVRVLPQTWYAMYCYVLLVNQLKLNLLSWLLAYLYNK